MLHGRTDECAQRVHSPLRQAWAFIAPMLCCHAETACSDPYRFVLVEEPDITGIPAFTQHSIYGHYSVSHDHHLSLQLF